VLFCLYKYLFWLYITLLLSSSDYLELRSYIGNIESFETLKDEMCVIKAYALRVIT